jgi:hypothetical protein
VLDKGVIKSNRAKSFVQASLFLFFCDMLQRNIQHGDFILFLSQVKCVYVYCGSMKYTVYITFPHGCRAANLRIYADVSSSRLCA